MWPHSVSLKYHSDSAFIELDPMVNSYTDKT